MKLVAPVYKLNPLQERILEFRGYNKKSVIDDGEMRDMYNLSSDEFPCLYQRKPRGIYSESFVHPTAMIVKNKKLAVISEGRFYYDGKMYPKLSLSDNTKMVAINTRICFFPEKMFFNTNTGDVGSLSASAVAENITVTVTTSTLSVPTGTGLSLSGLFKTDYVVQVTASDSKLNVSAVVKAVSKNEIPFRMKLS